MPELIAQLPLPTDGYCWRCQNRRVLPVAAPRSPPTGTATASRSWCRARRAGGRRSERGRPPP
jgi:hypothetical protein